MLLDSNELMSAAACGKASFGVVDSGMEASAVFTCWTRVAPLRWSSVSRASAASKRCLRSSFS